MTRLSDPSRGMDSLSAFARGRIGPDDYVMQRNIVAACDVVWRSNFFTARNSHHFGFQASRISDCLPARDTVVMARFRDGGLENILAKCGTVPHAAYVIVQTLIGDDGGVEDKHLSLIPDNVRAIFSKNIATASPDARLVRLPIGADWRMVDERIRREYVKRDIQAASLMAYLNISLETHPERPRLYARLASCAWVTARQSHSYGCNALTYRAYLSEMHRHTVCLSPEGKALDQYRTWDALYVKCVPVTTANTHTSAFGDLPLILIRDWSSVSQTALCEAVEDLQGRSFALEKLRASYWRAAIRDALTC
jgi:hypothetical protein